MHTSGTPDQNSLVLLFRQWRGGFVEDPYAEEDAVMELNLAQATPYVRVGQSERFISTRESR
jgi:hypothetical protein